MIEKVDNIFNYITNYTRYSTYYTNSIIFTRSDNFFTINKFLGTFYISIYNNDTVKKSLLIDLDIKDTIENDIDILYRIRRYKIEKL